jgi:hypothetical protein
MRISKQKNGKKDNYPNNACVEKRSMTRKVTAYCSRKRLLLLPYTYKLFSTRPHNTSTYISTGGYIQYKQRNTLHYSLDNSTGVLYRLTYYSNACHPHLLFNLLTPAQPNPTQQQKGRNTIAFVLTPLWLPGSTYTFCLSDMLAVT